MSPNSGIDGGQPIFDPSQVAAQAGDERQESLVEYGFDRLFTDFHSTPPKHGEKLSRLDPHRITLLYQLHQVLRAYTGRARSGFLGLHQIGW